VPDADDTPGAILALLGMYEGTLDETVSILQGCKWLLGVQNRDGGMPTFCKGWGRLPFDRSCADLTGHSLLAWIKSLEKLGNKIPKAIQVQIRKGIVKAIKYLQKHQNKDGSWLPLWFGSQLTANKTNPVYGTSRVGTYIHDCIKYNSLNMKILKQLAVMQIKAEEFLENQQNEDESWGATKGALGTIEETALAVSTLASYDINLSLKGLGWIEKQIQEKGLKSSPIGLYFASLWYDEKLYPLVFYVEALRRVLAEIS